MNGLREDMNSFLLDGLSNTSIAVGTFVAAPPLDSIQEFKMETGVYDARFGVSGGGQVNIVRKSGTNQLHGSLYEYLRNGDLDARNFFEPNVPPFHRNQYGASLAGQCKSMQSKVLVDVRSRPQSRWVPWFNKKNLASAIPGIGLEYQWAGDHLG